MHDIVEFVKAVTWPATVLTIVYLLLPELKLFAMNLAQRARTDTMVFGPITLTAPLSSQVQDRKIKFREYVMSLADSKLVESIAERLNLPAGKSVTATRKAIVAEMNGRVNNDQEMDQFLTPLRRIIKQDF
jgi:hypothetical protein